MFLCTAIVILQVYLLESVISLYPAAVLWEELRTRGTPFVSNNSSWSQDQKDAFIQSARYPSTYHYIRFIETKMVDLACKGYFVILAYSAVCDRPYLCVLHAGVVTPADHCPHLIIDYRTSGVNELTLPLAPTKAMQVGNALDRLFPHHSHNKLTLWTSVGNEE